MKNSQKAYIVLKTMIGLLGALVGLVLAIALFWWWIIPINAIVTKGHPFFVQKRYGKNKKVFGLIKFRSMRVDVNPNNAPSHMDPEYQKSLLTPFGKFLRYSSLDETPQLLNILFLQMAFIGPRPGAAINEEDLVIEREKFTPNAFAIRPGMSGLAQVKLNRSHHQNDKARLDHEYVKNISLWLDIKIFFLTFGKLFTVEKKKKD